LQSAFAAENIDARVFFWPLSSLPIFDAIPKNLNAYSIPNRSINLPSYHDMNKFDLKRILGIVKTLI
jgi:perosamine synthetase